MFAQVWNWKRDGDRRSNEVDGTVKVETEVANLNLDNEKLRKAIEGVEGKVDELVKVMTKPHQHH